MIIIKWNRTDHKWYSTKTNQVITPLKAGMLIDPELCDDEWILALRRKGFKYAQVPYSDLKRISK